MTVVFWENLKGCGGFSFQNIYGKQTKLQFGLKKTLLWESRTLPFVSDSVTDMLCNSGKCSERLGTQKC